MKKLYMVIWLLLCSLRVCGQSFSTLNRSDSLYFLYEVKQIDEFMERFNNDKFSFIREVYQTKHQKANFRRRDLMELLFNMEKPNWNKDDVRSFLKEVLDTLHPIYLDFTDSNWYAVANCRFSSNHKTITIPLVLHIKNISPAGARWVIAGIGSHPILKSFPVTPFVDKCTGVFHYMSSADNSVNFAGLDRAFEDYDNLNDYLEPSLAVTEKGARFMNMLLSGIVRLEYVDNIKYCFFQVDNWAFTVEHFDRNSLNKGWLINDLKKLNAAEKQALLNETLFRTQ